MSLLSQNLENLKAGSGTRSYATLNGIHVVANINTGEMDLYFNIEKL